MTKQESQKTKTANAETAEQTIEKLTMTAINAIHEAVAAAENLSRERHNQKLSTNRVAAVVKELKEIRKVMAAYCY